MASASSKPPKRHAHLVGSLPYPSERQAMRSALRILPNHLCSLPDGEVGNVCSEFPNGDRSAWTAIITERCAKDKSTWKITRRIERNEVGFQRDYKTGMRLKPLVSKKDLGGRLDFGWNEFARKSFEEFKEVRREVAEKEKRRSGKVWEANGVDDVMFQVGLPTALGMTFSMCAPVDAIRYASSFTERMAVEANDVVEMVEKDEEYKGKVQLQLDVPGELAMAHMMQGFGMGFAVRTVVDLVRRIRNEKKRAVVGLHLCAGDLNNEALINNLSLKKCVDFVHKVIEKWPADSLELNFVHIPMAAAKKAPTMQEKWYRPLRDLKLPQGTRLIAGFVHEKRSMSQHRKILNMVENITGHPVDVACSCGLGRRPLRIAETLMETTKELVES